MSHESTCHPRPEKIPVRGSGAIVVFPLRTCRPSTSRCRHCCALRVAHCDLPFEGSRCPTRRRPRDNARARSFGVTIGSSAATSIVIMSSQLSNGCAETVRAIALSALAQRFFGVGDERVPSAPLASGTRNQLTPRRNPRDFCGRFWAEPMIKQPASRSADERCNPEQPQLRKSPAADENRGTRAARRVH